MYLKSYNLLYALYVLDCLGHCALVPDLYLSSFFFFFCYIYCICFISCIFCIYIYDYMNDSVNFYFFFKSDS